MVSKKLKMVGKRFPKLHEVFKKQNYSILSKNLLTFGKLMIKNLPKLFNLFEIFTSRLSRCKINRCMATEQALFSIRRVTL